MGNTVSAAEMVANDIVSHVKVNKLKENEMEPPPGHRGAVPPPECPMHNKPKKSECPIQHGNDINPLNMVRYNKNKCF